jgi:hypothetical protein
MHRARVVQQLKTQDLLKPQLLQDTLPLSTAKSTVLISCTGLYTGEHSSSALYTSSSMTAIGVKCLEEACLSLAEGI